MVATPPLFLFISYFGVPSRGSNPARAALQQHDTLYLWAMSPPYVSYVATQIAQMAQIATRAVALVAISLGHSWQLIQLIHPFILPSSCLLHASNPFSLAVQDTQID